MKDTDRSTRHDLLESSVETTNYEITMLYLPSSHISRDVNHWALLLLYDMSLLLSYSADAMCLIRTLQSQSQPKWWWLKSQSVFPHGPWRHS
jgi:hypothetical protein